MFLILLIQGVHVNRELHLWSVQESFHKQLIDKIAKQFDMTSNDEDLGSFIKEIAKEQTGYYVDDYFKRLMKLKRRFFARKLWGK